MNITIDSMRDKLVTMPELRETLEELEPVVAVPFTVGDAIRFRAQTGWNHGLKALDGGQPVGVYVSVGIGKYAREYQLTKNCVLEACHAFNLPKNYVEDCPAELLVPAMNYWFREGLYGKGKNKTDLQFLTDESYAVSLSKQGRRPFSNLNLLDQAVAGIEAKYGQVEILADYKMAHSLRQTTVRLIVPNGHRVIESDTRNDVWSTGIQFKNSLSGTSQTSIEGYLFRWTCTNGMIDTRASSGAFTRRADTTNDEADQWVRQAVDEALAGLEGSFEAVQALTGLHIDGSLADTLRDVFEHYRIPINQRPKIIKILEEHPGEITMYVILNAITRVANEQGLDAATVDGLMRVGGELAHTAEHRCGACRRLLHAH